MTYYPSQNIADILPEGSRVYIVQPGDTIYSIGLQFGVLFEEIIRLNSVPQPDLIYPGQRLIIPAVRP